MKKDIIRYCGTSFLKGKSVEQIQHHSQVFISAKLVHEIKDITVSMMQEYKDDGYKIILMSGSYAFIIEEVADYFNTDGFYASKLDISKGIIQANMMKMFYLDKYELLKERI